MLMLYSYTLSYKNIVNLYYTIHPVIDKRLFYIKFNLNLKIHLKWINLPQYDCVA